MRGDALEAGKPVLEAADVGVDILNVVAAVDAFARSRIECDVQEAGILGEGPVGGASVADRAARRALRTGFNTRVKVAPSRSGIT